MPAPTPASSNPMLAAAMTIARVLAGRLRGDAWGTLLDIDKIDPDTVARGYAFAAQQSLAATSAATDVDFRTNPDYDVAIHKIRAYCEVGSAENTANGGLASFNAAHASVQLKDADRNFRILDGLNAAAGGAGGVDLGLLGANNGPDVVFPVPYVAKAQKGASIIRATFQTDGSWPGTRRLGILLTCSLRRKSYRQAEQASV